MRHADSFFTIGRGHEVCQDYARSRSDEDGVHVALADGCSGSPDTDFGARFLVMAAEAHQQDFNVTRIFRHAENAAWCTPGLRESALDATLITLSSEDGGVTARVVGDGVVAARLRDGRIEAWRVRFEPCKTGQVAAGYGSYLLHPDRMDAYVAAGANVRVVERYIDGELVGTETTSCRKDDPASFIHTLHFPVGDVDFVAAFSDGVESFDAEVVEGSKVREPVTLHAVLREVMAVKGGTGKFVQRRCQRFLRDHCVKHRWQHHDDFSMIAVWCAP